MSSQRCVCVSVCACESDVKGTSEGGREGVWRPDESNGKRAGVKREKVNDMRKSEWKKTGRGSLGDGV